MRYAAALLLTLSLNVHPADPQPGGAPEAGLEVAQIQDGDDCPGSANCRFHATPTGSSYWYHELPLEEAGYEQLQAVLQESSRTMAQKHAACRAYAQHHPQVPSQTRELLGGAQREAAFWDYAFVRQCCRDIGDGEPESNIERLAREAGVDTPSVCTREGQVIPPSGGNAR